MGVLMSVISIESLRSAFSFDTKTAFADDFELMQVPRNGTETWVMLRQYNATEWYTPESWAASGGANVGEYGLNGSYSSTALNLNMILENYCDPKKKAFCFLDDTGIFVVSPTGETVRVC